ncbi:peptidoglycan bridge formation glycyltransferase FemA/FemB family protein [Parablautia muri]|nr:peptidoglycan bridge formation glycyltransferase FemA/FemB family protein [Parablautia muri]
MFRYKNLAFLKIFDIWFEEELFYTADSSIKCLHENKKIDKNMYDFKITAKTFLLDISKEIEDIFACFDYKSCKYAINRANRDGIRVWKVEDSDDKKKYFDFQNLFCEEKGIPKLDADELNNIEIFCAETDEKEFLGGCAFIISGDKKTVRYKYGATLHKYNANEAIIWYAIQNYHARGFEMFDFGGVMPTEDKTSYYYHHYKFKKKFGGDLIDSYIYFKLKGVLKVLYCPFEIILKYCFKQDINNLVIWLNKHRCMK